MRKLFVTAVSIVFIGTALTLAPSHAREVEERSLASCAQVHQKFPSGVALSRSSRQAAVAAGFRAPQVKPKIYRQAVARIKPALKGVVCPVRSSDTDVAEPPIVNDPQYEAIATRVGNAGASCFVVRRDGRIVGEWYWQGRRATTPTIGFSTMKSVSGTLVGIAQTKGFLNIDQPASDFIHEWKGTPSSGVTIRHLLSMTSGREEGDRRILGLHPNPTSYAVGLGQAHPPGTVFRYGNGPLQTLALVLTRATGEPVKTFAERELFKPLGMNLTSVDPDPSGGINMVFIYLTTCRDLSAMVQLYVDGGVWKGQRVLSEEFVRQALSPSSSIQPGYGLTIWLNTPGAPWFNPSLAPDTFDFLGLCGQIGRGVPSQRLVFTAMVTAGLDQAVACEQEGRGIPELRAALVLP
jgi:CubicO group peptidase (beta-lactamase class C family)